MICLTTVTVCGGGGLGGGGGVKILSSLSEVLG